jgi:hypothetical protein
MSANAGTAGAASSGGLGGTATGGSTNTTGNNGTSTLGDLDGGGDAAETGGGDGGTNWDGFYDTETSFWTTGTFPTAGTDPGGGGGGGIYSLLGFDIDVAGQSGGSGRVEFYYT